MEDLVKEIINGNNAVVAGALVVLWRFHTQAMKRLDTVVDSIVKMDKNVEKHSIQLEFGSKEMARIDEHNKVQDNLIAENRDDIQMLKGKVSND